MSKAAPTLKAPFPAFGGKSRIADEVWRRFGAVRNYVEPFCFSAAVLLARPEPWEGSETINDSNGYVSNFWRAVQNDPQAVASYADSPVNENDLHAWHAWLVEKRDSLAAQLEGDPEFYDAKVAGKWCWGICCWIGSGFCNGEGPWHRVQSADGVWRLLKVDGTAGQGVNRQLIHLGDAGQGVKRKRIHLGNAGRGVKRQRIHLGDAGRGANTNRDVYGWMQALADRLHRVRVCCGDWARVCTPTVTIHQGLTAMFLDPPYSAPGRDAVYGHTEDFTVAKNVYEWCLEWQNHPLMRIALCGYEGEHDLPGWEVLEWKTPGGYANQNSHSMNNCFRERIWFSPNCIRAVKERMLFE